jgi:uncharacterized protein YdaU (DUF1376 family)
LNYYNRHIGDYAKQTAHLSFAEDGAYNRMLDYYYSKELPLPLDRAVLYRKVRAKTKPEQAMIDSLLAEFFYEAEDGWHKNRCDEEIMRAREAGEDEAAKRENEKERQQRYRQRRKEIFAALREYGIVPKWDTPIDELQRLLNTHLSRGSRDTGNAPVTRTATANQEPIANNQEPVKSLGRTARATRLPTTWTLPADWGEWARQEKPHLGSAGALQAVEEKFRDYWLAQPGQKGVKQDWQATWRNWVRNEHGAKNGNGNNGLRNSRDDERSAARRAILQPSAPAERDVTRDSERVD